ncbi:MAG: hypothetical protein ACI9J3_002271 [Parvicellaceae bacterium]|jgi:hypothetical protein
MSISRTWIILFSLTIIGCHNSDTDGGNLTRQNELLTNSISKDLNELAKSPIYKWYSSSFPHECKPQFDYLTDRKILSDGTLGSSRLDSLTTLKNLIQRHRRVIGETDIQLYDYQLAQLQNRLSSSDFSEHEIEQIRFEFLNIQKSLFCSHLSDQYYASFSVIDTLSLNVFPHQEVVELGDTFRADLYMTCFETIEIHDFIVYREMDTTKFPTEFRVPIDTVRRRKRTPTIEIVANETGDQKYHVLGIVEDNRGNQLNYIREINFKVKN